MISHRELKIKEKSLKFTTNQNRSKEDLENRKIFKDITEINTQINGEPPKYLLILHHIDENSPKVLKAVDDHYKVFV